MGRPRALVLALVGAGVALGLLMALLVARAGTRGPREPVRESAPCASPDVSEGELEPAFPPTSEADAAQHGERVALAPGAAGPLGFDEPGADEAVLQVRVLALESGRPFSGVPLRIETPAGELLPARRALGPKGDDPLRSDRAGRLDLVVPARQEFVLCANPQIQGSGPSARIPVRPLEPHSLRTVVLELVRAPDLFWHGRVLDAATGMPVREARLRPRRASGAPALCEARSGADGRVRFALASALVSTLRVEAPGFAPLVLELGRGHEREQGEELVRLQRSAALEVELHDAAGRALPGLELVLSGPALGEADGAFVPTQRSPERRAESDSDGRGLFTDLVPEFELELEVRRDALRLHHQRLPPLFAGERRLLRVEFAAAAEGH